jgi:hypothetical protein
MMGKAGARRLLTGALMAAAILALPQAAHAEFRGKGSVVGRILSESVSEAEASVEKLKPSPSARPAAGKVISREALNALMKRPTEPVYDPLRPMSGRWVRCQSATTRTPAVQSHQDRYSSWDRSHFTHTVSFASDKDCKTVVSQERTSYECSAVDKKVLSCKAVKRETKAGGAAWVLAKVASGEKPIELSFLGLGKNGIGKKKKSAKTHDPRKLEARIGGETVSLVFEPAPPRAHKTND